MKTVYLVHGWDGSPEGDWFPWAINALRNKGYDVIAPTMPHPEKPEITPWVDHLRPVATKTGKDVLFIGHSMGCQTIMRFMEASDVPASGAIFVAGWFNLINLENAESEAIAKPWIETPMNFEKIKINVPRSVVLLGDNDPWVPYEETKHSFETLLGSTVITISNGGHITSDNGFGPLPQLLEVLEKYFK